MRMAFLSALLVGLTSSSVYASPEAEADMHLVTAELSRQLLDPDSMVLSEVVSIPDPFSSGEIVYICGRVKSRNSFGGYAQPAKFVALVSSDAFSKVRMVQTMKIAETDQQAQAVGRVCEEQAAISARAADAGPDVLEALRSLSGMQLFCRARVEGACAELSAVKQKLDNLGWCSVVSGQSDDARTWKPCN